MERELILSERPLLVLMRWKPIFNLLPRIIRRLVLVGADPRPDDVAEEVDVTVAGGEPESGDSSNMEADVAVHEAQILHEPRGRDELIRRA